MDNVENKEDEFDFDLTERTYGPFPIDGEQYILVEATSQAATDMRNITLRGASMKDGRVEMGAGLAQAEPFLVSKCLFKLDDAGKRHPMSLDTIRNWPSRVVKPLYNKAYEISGLKEDDGKAAKND